jgi:methylated-DNA-[protein]-cysteine S-methyltransferase
MTHAVFPTEAGWMGIMASRTGLTMVVLPADAPEGVMKMIGVTDAGDCSVFSSLIKKFRNYFKGIPVAFEEPLDMSAATDFQKRVWRAAMTIPYGEVRSYTWVAEKAGSPHGQRAAGSALGANPLPIIVPCHRVIAADGSAGGFTGGGGLPAKIRLLTLEGVNISS